MARRPRPRWPTRQAALVFGALAALASVCHGQATGRPSATQRLSHTLTSTAGLLLHGVDAVVVTHRGRRALRLTESAGLAKTEAENSLAILTESAFENGAIRVDLAGRPAPVAVTTARGFVGIAFRLTREPLRFEYVYLRPTNARADDQLRRNHTTQYSAFPDFPWHRLRQESPGLYESYVDLEAGAWTRVKILVRGTEARLYVGGTEQPCLIVKDLKLGRGSGAVGLWIGPGTEAYFSDLSIERESP